MAFRRKPWLALTLAVLGLSCVDRQQSPLPTGPSPIVALVRFEHRVPTARRGLETVTPIEAAAVTACMNRVGHAHLRPSWRSFKPQVMTADGDNRWILEFDDVPVGQSISLRVYDPNACSDNPSGLVVTATVFANNVQLVHRASTADPADAGFRFSVSVGGTVSH